MLNSIFTILQNPVLIGGLFLSVILGSGSFIAAIELCKMKGVWITTLKYILASISIEAITNFFMIVLCPSEFLLDSHIFRSINIVISLLLFWILTYEVYWFLKHPKTKCL